MSAKKFILTPEPLTNEAFLPFGEVVDTSNQAPVMINQGTTERYDNLAKVECLGDGSYAAINLFRAQPRQLPMRIHMLEKHPYGSQSFHPLSHEPYLVLVARGVAQPKADDLRLFLARADQGINYRHDTWHHPVLGLNKICDFLVVDRKGDGLNCDEYYFDEDTFIEIQR